MTIFWPSTHPSSRRLCRNASSRGGLSEGDVRLRRPIRGIFPACCASAASGAVSRQAAPARNARRSIYWMISSACASTVGGIVSPRALAALRLIASSKWRQLIATRALFFWPRGAAADLLVARDRRTADGAVGDHRREGVGEGGARDDQRDVKAVLDPQQSRRIHAVDDVQGVMDPPVSEKPDGAEVNDHGAPPGRRGHLRDQPPAEDEAGDAETQREGV